MDETPIPTPSSEHADEITSTVSPPTAPTVLVALIAAGVYVPAVLTGFVTLDDDWNVYRNPLLHPVTIGGVLRFWTDAYHMNYSPLTHTLYAIEAALWGDWPVGYHAVNVLLHAASTALLGRILYGFVRDKRAAAIGALLFALHPIQVESVAWVTGRLSLLSGFLALLSIGWYVHWRRTGRSGAYVLATIAALLAMFAKPAAVSIPLILVAIDLLVFKYGLRRTASATALLFVVAVGFALWARAIQSLGQLDFIPSWWQRPLVAGDALTFYLYKILLPVRFGIDYGRTPEFVLDHAWVYATAAVPILLLIAALVFTRRGLVSAAAAVFMLALLPSLGLVPYTFQRYSTVADRYIYLAMIGPAFVAAWLVSRTKGTTVFAIGLVIVAALAARTVAQTRHWRNSKALYRSALTIHPNSGLALGGLANLHMARGSNEEAIALYRKMIRQGAPNLPEVHNNLGTALLRSGNIDGAIHNYRRALELDPDLTDARGGLGDAYLAGGKLDEARREYQAVLDVQPEHRRVLINLAAVEVRSRRPSRAIELYRHLLKIDPDNWRIHQSLGNVLRDAGDVAGAIKAYENVIKQKPDAAQVRLSLGDLYVAHKRYDQAIIQYSNLLDTDSPKDLTHVRLGAALAAKGQIDEAIGHLSEAVQINPYNPEAHKALGQLYLSRQEPEPAMRHLAEALRLRSDDAALHVQVGSLLYAEKEFAKAAEHYRETLKLDEKNAAAANYLAWILATCSDETLRDAQEAVALAERAADLTDRKIPSILDTLGAAYAEAGRFDDAIAAARQARKLAAADQPELAAEIDKRIVGYEKKKPFRQ